MNTGAALVGTPMTITLAISYGVIGAMSGTNFYKLVNANGFFRSEA